MLNERSKYQLKIFRLYFVAVSSTWRAYLHLGVDMFARLVFNSLLVQFRGTCTHIKEGGRVKPHLLLGFLVFVRGVVEVYPRWWTFGARKRGKKNLTIINNHTIIKSSRKRAKNLKKNPFFWVYHKSYQYQSYYD